MSVHHKWPFSWNPCCTIAVSATIAMGLIPVDQVVAAPEVVIAKSPNLVVQPLETAIVRAIDVHAGEQVHAGQILARLDPTFAVADPSANAAQVTVCRRIRPGQCLSRSHSSPPRTSATSGTAPSTVDRTQLRTMPNASGMRGARGLGLPAGAGRDEHG
jgi:hypothetical protein